MTSLEELKKSFIKDEENFEEKELIELIEKVNKICELDKKGNVSFKNRSLGDKEKIQYILIARFLANKLDSNILKEVKNEELERILKKSRDQIRARVSDLRKEDVIEDVDRETHQIKPLQIHKLLKNE